jgi:hypothetical protein
LALAWVWQLPNPSKSECGSCQTRVWQLPNPSEPEFGSCQTWGWQRPYLSLAVDTFQTYNAKVQINTHTYIVWNQNKYNDVEVAISGVRSVPPCWNRTR